jgi:hypothetical protein
MIAPASTIPMFVHDFMEKKLWRGKSMRSWLNKGLQEAADKIAVHCREECDDLLGKLAVKTGDERIASLKLEDGSLSGGFDTLVRDKSGDELNLCQRIESNKTKYTIALEKKDFLTQELLPTLQELENHATPTKAHQTVIEETIQNLAIMFLYPMKESKDIRPALMPENAESTYQAIRTFFSELQQKISKVTKQERVFIPGEMTR